MPHGGSNPLIRASMQIPFQRLRKGFQSKAPKVQIPIRLHARNIYILPTRYGILLFSVLGGMLLGAINYNNNMAFLLTFLLGGMAFVSLFQTHRNLSGLRIETCAASEVFAGEPMRFQWSAKAENRCREAIAFHLVRFDTETLADVQTARETTIFIDVQSEQRGWMPAGPLTISTCYPMGIFKAWSRMEMHHKGLVYPRPISDPFAFSRDDAFRSGELSRSPKSGCDDFEGLKSYQAGDPIQQIFWKAMAKGQGLQTKTFTGMAGGEIRLEWDQIPEDDVEIRLSRLCGMVMRANDMGLAYGLRIPGIDIPPSKGEAHKRICLKSLALFQSERPGEASPPLRA